MVRVSARFMFILVSLFFCQHLFAEISLSADEMQLARENSFDLRILQRIKEASYSVEALHGVNRAGNRVVVPGLSFTSGEQQSYALIKRLAEEMQASGYQIFIQELGYSYTPDRIAIIKSKNKFDILRVRKTLALTAGLSTRQIISKLQDWDKRYGLLLIGAGYNWLKAELIKLPDNIEQFSNEVLAFCPEVLIFRSETLEQFQQDLRADHTIFLRWK